MGLKSFFQRKDKTDTAAAPARSRRASASPADAAEAVQQARTRARQRLVGAVVLLGIGIIGFPLLFETQPRPIPVDLPIEIPRKESAPLLHMPATRLQPARSAEPKAPASAPGEIVETAAEGGHEIPAPASAPVVAAPVPAASKAGPKAASPKPAVAAEKPSTGEAAHPAAAQKPVPSAAEEGIRAKALLEGKAAAGGDAAGRYVVQVGAFAEVTAARETRLKVEKLGLKTYTQVVETDAGKRIRVRVGPFASRDEADKAASKLKAAGLGSAVLTL